ncbi:GspH/FimT family pseudopilin [Stutzerimonas zhaodongensis]|uniref:GspH/FimT family pseudopilin n=1 Tax=Stutzerimonas zhaodongensis TaxID=1176257 RepID=UPI001F4E8DC5|nr:GspH/FimT family pseudopilin [Stutzerimonas zhaodongensis]UNG19545.1 GspH/FimT family pseudopilin [Stutzerimonas zhaodongensis]
MKPSGFTLLELLITLSVLSVTLLVAVPQLQDSLVQAEVDTKSRLLLTSISQARHEAIKRNTFVVMRATGGWERGWVIFIDSNQNAQQDAGEILLFSHSDESNLQIQGNSALSTYIGYMGSGRTRQASGAFLAGSILVCSPNRTRKIVVNAGGRARMEELAENGCSD